MNKNILAKENSPPPKKVNHEAEENYKVTFQAELNIINLKI